MSLPLQSVQNLLNKNNGVNFWVYSNFPLLGENCREKHRKQQCQKSPRAMQEGDVFPCYGPGRIRSHLPVQAKGITRLVEDLETTGMIMTTIYSTGYKSSCLEHKLITNGLINKWKKTHHRQFT